MFTAAFQPIFRLALSFYPFPLFPSIFFSLALFATAETRIIRALERNTWSISLRITRQFFFLSQWNDCCRMGWNAVANILMRREIVYFSFRRYVRPRVFWAEIFIGCLWIYPRQCRKCHRAHMHHVQNRLVIFFHISTLRYFHSLASCIKNRKKKCISHLYILSNHLLIFRLRVNYKT